MNATVAITSAHAGELQRTARGLGAPQRQEAYEQGEHDVLVLGELKAGAVEPPVVGQLRYQREQKQPKGVLGLAVRVVEPLGQKEAEQRERDASDRPHHVVDVVDECRLAGATDGQAHVQVVLPHQDEAHVVDHHRDDGDPLERVAREELPGLALEQSGQARLAPRRRCHGVCHGGAPFFFVSFFCLAPTSRADARRKRVCCL